MCRVLLVDDEAIARVGLRSTFAWESHGYQLVGEASNGLKAMPWIQNGEVDILITDIAMPVMNGLELTRRTRQLCPWVKVLLLSCHSDFEYVREGIRLGASDYILKPTLDSDSLKTVLDEMRKKMEEEKQLRLILEQHKNHERSMQLKAAENAFSKVLSGDLEVGQLLRIPHNQESFRIALYKLEADSIGKDLLQEDELLELADTLKQHIYDTVPASLAVRLRPDLLVVWLPAEHTAPSKLKVQFSSSYSVGISSEFENIRDVSLALKEAKRSLDSCFFNGPGCLMHAEDLPSGKQTSPVSYSTEISGLRTSLSMGHIPKAEGHVQRIMRRWGITYLCREEVLREAEEILSLLALYSPWGDSTLENIKQLGRLNYADEVISHVMHGFHCIREGPQLQVPDSTLHERLVLQAVQYIKAHYTETISLQQAADHVNVSRNYFSEIFKRVTEQNFIDFVIDMRVKRAKELLLGSSLKVYEVAEQSGFNDVKYFSKQFKKIVGMTPSEFQGHSRK